MLNYFLKGKTMSVQNQQQDWQGAYNFAIKTVWYLIALSIALSFIGAVKISYQYDGNALSFLSSNFSFIVTVASAVLTVGCFIGERAISSNLPNLKIDEDILKHIKDANAMKRFTILFFITFLIFFAITPVGQFVPFLLENKVIMSIFACVPLSLALATIWFKTAIRIRQEYLNPKR